PHRGSAGPRRGTPRPPGLHQAGRRGRRARRVAGTARRARHRGEPRRGRRGRLVRSAPHGRPRAAGARRRRPGRRARHHRARRTAPRTRRVPARRPPRVAHPAGTARAPAAQRAAFRAGGPRLNRPGPGAVGPLARTGHNGGVPYTGNTHVGGPADVRQLPELTISKLAVGPMDNNAYLLRCTRTGEAVLIDAAAAAARLLDLLGGDGLARVITTHRHRDHWGALADVVGATGARTVAHPADAPELPVSTDEPVEHGDTVRVG